MVVELKYVDVCRHCSDMFVEFWTCSSGMLWTEVEMAVETVESV